MARTNRRTFIGRGAAAAAAVAAATLDAAAEPRIRTARAAQPAPAPADKPVKKVHYRNGRKPEKTPLFNSVVSYGNLVFIAGVGYHQEGDIKVHTKGVLDQIQQNLERVGSSMDKVLKCNVYLNDLKDYAAMNEVFLGRFGPEPPVRTTIAAPGGIPGNSLVEIDVIAYI
jgi:2-iminobutanoate/2-iminopropanoate deaminase